jgi:hypothetical protein
MFSTFGAVLTIFGALSNRELYETHSLGININLAWGLVLLVFGVCMLVLALRSRGRSDRPADTTANSSDQSQNVRK